MTTESDHPFVTRYLQQFDEVAEPIPGARRALLREEVAEHLREAVPAGSSNADAAAVIAQFGSPAEILGQELDGAGQALRAKQPGHVVRNTVVIVVAVIVAAILSVLASHLLIGSQVTANPGTSVVNKHPEGPDRITTGEGYFEYEAAIKAMPDPLPAGAEYPDGVPVGLDSGTSDSGTLESGAGTVVAHFTWLCAWESEYLIAMSKKDAERQVAAESMITKWSTSAFYLNVISDPDKGWTTSVINPMKFGDPSGVRQDRPRTCAQASIINVG
ncbi:hypothetical protein [Cryobacterium zhongshanensis]|uniref:Uncharacterized protein n=1 Tax=Cryobacterium zhongshanensis TaxID=2928153 RepID=A0AA41UHC8_9MICO|nr:hypothetical protein [Cryobacterium zhongshanensis]MCI4658284.1 hypothetical protein [Cryobacterium zhongshanensis]